MFQRLAQRAEDLGVVLALDAWCVDTWCTRVRLHVEAAPFPYSVAGARLLPWTLEGETQYDLDPLPLVLVRSVDGGTELVFGALPAQATHATLIVTRMQVDEVDRVDVRLPASFDPFDPDDPASERGTLVAFHQSEDEDLSLAPEWECRGAWRYKLVAPQQPPAGRGRAPLPVLAPVGPCALAVPWLDLGEHGTLLAVDVVPPSLAGWGALWKEFALRDEGRIPVPHPRIVVHAGDATWDAQPLGPFGRLGTRLYFEGPPVDPDAPLRLAVDELHGLRYDPPLEHTFDARDFELSPTFEIPFSPLGLEGAMRFTLHDVYGDDACFILMYRAELPPGEVRDAWFSEVHLVDGWGVEQICQEDGTQPLRDYGLEAPAGVRAMRFGTVRPERPLRLRITALDAAWHLPRTVECAGVKESS